MAGPRHGFNVFRRAKVISLLQGAARLAERKAQLNGGVTTFRTELTCKTIICELITARYGDAAGNSSEFMIELQEAAQTLRIAGIIAQCPCLWSDRDTVEIVAYPA